MLNYIAQRYGNPVNAWAHEVKYGWYDRGGMLEPGLTLAYNGTGRPEQVIPGGRGGSGEVHVHLHNEGVIGSQQELERWLLESTRKLARTKGGGNVQTAFGRS
jgi:SLT domain-containing protein